MKTPALCAVTLVCTLVAVLQCPQPSNGAATKQRPQTREDLTELGMIQEAREKLSPAGLQLENPNSVAGVEKRSVTVSGVVTAIKVGRVVWKGIKKIRGRRSVVDDWQEDDDLGVEVDDEILQNDDYLVQAAEIEEALAAATPDNLNQLALRKVVAAEKYEVVIPGESDEWFKRKHNGVVVTLTNGERYLVTKGYEFYRPKSTVVLDAKVMSDAWKLVDMKDDVETATLGDYIRATENSYNSKHAAAKMMAFE